MPDILTEELMKSRDVGNAAFVAKLIPNIPAETVLGVRSPELKRIAKAFSGTPEAEAFLQSLPHDYLDENNLHAELINFERDPSHALGRIEEFLPYVDNWATCDTIHPKAFVRDPSLAGARVSAYLSSGHGYTVRYGIAVRMRYYLDDRFDPSFPEEIAELKREDYYIRMMAAWYFATGLAKQYDAFLPYLEKERLDVWTHNKTVQKAIESYRIPSEAKAYLKTLKRKE